MKHLFLKGYAPWNKGESKATNLILLAMSEVRRQQVAKGKAVPPSQLGHIAWNKGMKINCKKYPNIGHQVKHSLETIEKIRASRKGKGVGQKNGWWKGGITKIDRLCRTMPEYCKWRSGVFQRDKWACKTCGKNNCYITAHHLKSFSKIIKENYIKTIMDARKCIEMWDINNGLALCEDCHELTDNYKGKLNRKGVN